MAKVLICIACITPFFISTNSKSFKLASNVIIDNNNYSTIQYARQITEIKEIIKSRRFSYKYCFLVDLKLPSGKKRFFIYDLNKDVIIEGGLVAHGSCNNYFLRNVWFSNLSGCGCSSCGLYKIGIKYYGKFGMSYKLIGMQKTNSNAYKRSIVLHSYKDVPDKEIFPEFICNSLGCPMTSINFLKKLSAIIDGSRKPILLYIF